jgi:hypothetical protein
LHELTFRPTFQHIKGHQDKDTKIATPPTTTSLTCPTQRGRRYRRRKFSITAWLPSPTRPPPTPRRCPTPNRFHHNYLQTQVLYPERRLRTVAPTVHSTA